MKHSHYQQNNALDDLMCEGNMQQDNDAVLKVSGVVSAILIVLLLMALSAYAAMVFLRG